MIGIFRQKAPGNVALLLIVGLFLKLPLFMFPKMLPALPQEGRLYHEFSAWITRSEFPFLSSVLAFLLLYIQALLITSIINEYRMTMRQTFLPGLSFLLITSLLPEWNFLSGPLIASTLVLWALARLFKLYNHPAANSIIYNIGLLLGLASFFYFPSFLFSASMLIGLLILRPFRLNEILLLLLGVTTPFYFYAVYLFLADRLVWEQLVTGLHIHTPALGNSLWIVGSTILIIIPFLIGAYYIQSNLRKMLIQARKNWSIVLIFLLFAIMFGFVNGQGTLSSWLLIVGPFAAFHACAYFYPPKKWISSLLFFATVAFILVQQYMTPAWH